MSESGVMGIDLHTLLTTDLRPKAKERVDFLVLGIQSPHFEMDCGKRAETQLYFSQHTG